MPFGYNPAWSNSAWSRAGSSHAGWSDAQNWAEAEAAAQRLAEDEQTLKRRFWRKLCALAARLPFAEDLVAAHYCAFDRQTPAHVKAALVGALAYFVLPADVIPDILPVVGYTDDAAMLAAAIRLVAQHITPDHREAARQAIARMRGAA
jgi:uncharacterized membrane protein YkvA (DUF1232 family)